MTLVLFVIYVWVTETCSHQLFLRQNHTHTSTRRRLAASTKEVM